MLGVVKTRPKCCSLDTSRSFVGARPQLLGGSLASRRCVGSPRMRPPSDWFTSHVALLLGFYRVVCVRPRRRALTKSRVRVRQQLGAMSWLLGTLLAALACRRAHFCASQPLSRLIGIKRLWCVLRCALSEGGLVPLNLLGVGSRRRQESEAAWQVFVYVVMREVVLVASSCFYVRLVARRAGAPKAGHANEGQTPYDPGVQARPSCRTGRG